MMAKPLVVTKIVFNKLPELQGELRRQASAAVRKAAHDIEAHAKDVVPVDTGNLKNSIQASMEGELTAVVAVGAEYGVYVEFGTGARGAASNIERPEGIRYSSDWAGMPAQPYLTPAAEAVRPSFEAAMRDLLK